MFAQLFAGLGGELPFLTRVVIARQQLRRPLLHLHRRRSSSPASSRSSAGTRPTAAAASSTACMLKIPVIGMLLRKIAVARFCRTLSTLTSSGVPILDGLEITAKTSGNAIIEDAIMAVRKAVEEGKTHQRAAGRDQGLPADGGADDQRRRADRRPRPDAVEDRRLLRGRGRHRGGRPDEADRAAHDHGPGRRSSAPSSPPCTCRCTRSSSTSERPLRCATAQDTDRRGDGRSRPRSCAG